MSTVVSSLLSRFHATRSVASNRTNVLRIPVAVFLLATLTGVSMAQSGTKGVAAGKSADEEWLTLKTLANPSQRSRPAVNDAVAAEATRRNVIASLRSDADKLKDFQSKHATHREAKEAKRLEALLLVQAWQIGDAVSDARRNQLVSEIRGDPSIPEAKRAEVAALADHVGVEKRPGLSGPAKLLAYEQIIRGLNVEFPTMPNGYEALVQVAKHSDDSKARALAREVAAMPAAPKAVRDEADALARRYDLIGKSLPEIAFPVLGPGNVAERAQRKPVIVYSWATFARGSIALAKDIAANAPPGIAIIGVNLDTRDLAPARQLATSEKLPGDQVYDWMGRKGDLAQRIFLLDPGVAYLVGRDGIIRSVSAHHDLKAALASVRSL